MTQQREAITDTLRAPPFNPAGDLREQRPLFDTMVAVAPVPPDVVTIPGNWAACQSSASTFPAPPPSAA